MFDTTDSDPISPALQMLIHLFASDLGAVKFPDMDRSVLDSAAEQVKERATAVGQAQLALEAALQALAESQESLLQKGQRALAYARVYAEAHEPLARRLEAIQLPRGGRRSSEGTAGPKGAEGPVAPKRRGRPPKVQGASLFNEATPTPEDVDAAPDNVEAAA